MVYMNLPSTDLNPPVPETRPSKRGGFTLWFFGIGILVGLLAIPAVLYFKAQSVLGEISVAEQTITPNIFTPRPPVNEPPIIPPPVEEAVPPDAKIDQPQPEVSAPAETYVEPAPEGDRLNFLLLGIRGVADPYGGTLTDSIMVVSYRLSNGRLALISLPRDLFITLPFRNVRSKINYAYALGRKLGNERDGLELAKHAVQYVTGLKIDYVVRADFEAFQKAVDTLGGVEITLAKPFVENLQWRGEGGFALPAGQQTLTGKQALYYVRSRYSTSDFDRARRQQQILLALKDKVTSLGVITNPGKISDLLSIVGDHVRTDMAVETMKRLIPLTQNADFTSVQTKVFDNSPGGRLYSTFINRQYVLLPRGGTFAGLREDAHNILK